MSELNLKSPHLFHYTRVICEPYCCWCCFCLKRHFALLFLSFNLDITDLKHEFIISLTMLYFVLPSSLFSSCLISSPHSCQNRCKLANNKLIFKSSNNINFLVFISFQNFEIIEPMVSKDKDSSNNMSLLKFFAIVSYFFLLFYFKDLFFFAIFFSQFNFNSFGCEEPREMNVP